MCSASSAGFNVAVTSVGATAQTSSARRFGLIESLATGTSTSDPVQPSTPLRMVQREVPTDRSSTSSRRRSPCHRSPLPAWSRCLDRHTPRRLAIFELAGGPHCTTSPILRSEASSRRRCRAEAGVIRPTLARAAPMDRLDDQVPCRPFPRRPRSSTEGISRRSGADPTCAPRCARLGGSAGWLPRLGPLPPSW